MYSSTLDSSFINRLKQLVASKYGKNIEIRQLLNITDLDIEQDTFTRGMDLHVPIKVNGSILGSAIVSAANDLNDEKQQSVAQLIRMVLEPAMYSWYLEQKEANLQEIQKTNFAPENVRIFSDEAMPDFDEVISDSAALDKSLAPELISNLIHLEGSNETSLKKVALQIHDLTTRWAFIPFADIKGQLHSAFDIAKMGAITIYIENVETLNQPEQELIMDYLNDTHFSDEPLILTTTSLKLEDLNKVPTLEKNLIDELMVNSFDVDRAPMSTSRLREVLELFFIKDETTDA